MNLTVRNLVIEYKTEGYAVRAIDDLSFEGRAGELVVLLGPSGSGKTSLLSCLAGILTPTSGSIMLGDQDITQLNASGLAAYRRSTVGIVFQASNLIQSLTARENIAAPLIVAKKPRREAVARADALLAHVGLTDRAHHRPARMSGGQQQRVALARGLAHDPPILLADEPTANLDYINAEAVIRLLRDLRSDGRLIIVSTHDDRMVRIADRVVEMVQDFHSAGAGPQRVEYAANETIFEQGTRGDLVYQIESGKVDIVRMGEAGATLLATLGPGQYFGELGPLLGFPRSATVRAKSNVVLTSFGIRHFRETVQGSGNGAALARPVDVADPGSRKHTPPRTSKPTTKKAGVKKAAVKKTAVKKSGAKKTGAKKTAVKKRAVKKTAS